MEDRARPARMGERPPAAPRRAAAVGAAAGLGAGAAPAPDLLMDATPRGWAEVFDARRVVRVGDDAFCCYSAGLDEGGVVCVLLHGGGLCALSWGAVAGVLRKRVGVLAFDARGHGESVCAEEGDLSAERMVADVVGVVREVLGEGREVVLVGHSMGGAVAVRVAAGGGVCVRGVVVIDVVEGSAMAALPFMAGWLARRKKAFASVEKGVRYAVSAGHVRNVESARLSVPAQLVRAGGRWVWRTDLERSRVHWTGWYAGLSALFLGVPAPKLLVLAGVDRLDRELTIGQMMGKFQNIVIPGAGHLVQEDRPGETAQVILDFLARNALLDDDQGAVGGAVQPGVVMRKPAGARVA